MVVAGGNRIKVIDSWGAATVCFDMNSNQKRK